MLRVGERRGYLQVLDASQGHRWDGPIAVRCTRCGNELVVRRDNLITGHTTSCGCLRDERLAGKPFPQHLAPRNDAGYEIGSVHGRWTVISEIRPSSRKEGRKDRTVLCECSCEDRTQKWVTLSHLGKKSKSCGCLKVEGNSLRTRET